MEGIKSDNIVVDVKFYYPFASKEVNMKAAIFFLVLSIALIQTEAHGRLTDPIQRAALWRDPQWTWANPTRPDNDEQLFCGGRPVTDNTNGTCGLCGDSVLDAKPRNAEIGGSWDRGVIVRNYTEGQTISVSIYLSISHIGYWEFWICDYSKNGAESEECFQQYSLPFADGTNRYINNNLSSRTVNHQIQLPQNLTCARCVLQWHWVAEDTKQIYRNCADISIH